MHKEAALEGLLFIAGEDGMSKKEIETILDVNQEELNNLLSLLQEKYQSESSGIVLEVLGEKYKLVTKKEHKEYYEKYFEAETDSSLSSSALEVLAIIAYNAPITRSMVDEVRGVSSSHLIRKLLSKNLIYIVGKAELPGRPNLYETTSTFLDYFGLSSISDLPVLEEKEEDTEEKNLYDSKYRETTEIVEEL